MYQVECFCCGVHLHGLKRAQTKDMETLSMIMTKNIYGFQGRFSQVGGANNGHVRKTLMLWWGWFDKSPERAMAKKLQMGQSTCRRGNKTQEGLSKVVDDVWTNESPEIDMANVEREQSTGHLLESFSLVHVTTTINQFGPLNCCYFFHQYDPWTYETRHAIENKWWIWMRIYNQ